MKSAEKLKELVDLMADLFQPTKIVKSEEAKEKLARAINNYVDAKFADHNREIKSAVRRAKIANGEIL